MRVCTGGKVTYIALRPAKGYDAHQVLHVGARASGGHHPQRHVAGLCRASRAVRLPSNEQVRGREGGVCVCVCVITVKPFGYGKRVCI